jgi:alpha/beta superfamily hydrolase
LTARTTERFTIDGPAGTLEVAIGHPVHAPSGIALVAHPNPVQGGTLDNKVAQTLARTFQGLGYASVRFNFRGVGASEGTFDEGIGETDDAHAALDHARARFGHGLPLVLAGFSFGCFVQWRLAQRVAAQRMVWSVPRSGASPSAACPRTRSSSTARTTTWCRSPPCSPGPGRRNCRSSSSPAAVTSSTVDFLA